MDENRKKRNYEHDSNVLIIRLELLQLTDVKGLKSLIRLFGEKGFL